MDKRETEELMILASAIDSRRVNDAAVAIWQQVLATVSYSDAVTAHIEFRKSSPGVYLEPGHILAELRKARARHRELYGIHPAPPAGKWWAVDAMNDPRREIQK